MLHVIRLPLESDKFHNTCLPFGQSLKEFAVHVSSWVFLKCWSWSKLPDKKKRHVFITTVALLLSKVIKIPIYITYIKIMFITFHNSFFLRSSHRNVVKLVPICPFESVILYFWLAETKKVIKRLFFSVCADTTCHARTVYYNCVFCSCTQHHIDFVILRAIFIVLLIHYWAYVIQ